MGDAAGKDLECQKTMDGKASKTNGLEKEIPSCCLKALASVPESEAKCHSTVVSGWFSASHTISGHYQLFYFVYSSNSYDFSTQKITIHYFLPLQENLGNLGKLSISTILCGQVCVFLYICCCLCCMYEIGVRTFLSICCLITEIAKLPSKRWLFLLPMAFMIIMNFRYHWAFTEKAEWGKYKISCMTLKINVWCRSIEPLFLCVLNLLEKHPFFYLLRKSFIPSSPFCTTSHAYRHL